MHCRMKRLIINDKQLKWKEALDVYYSAHVLNDINKMHEKHSKCMTDSRQDKNQQLSRTTC